MKKFIALLCLLINSFFLFSQNNEIENYVYRNDKFPAVFAVIFIILIGIILFLIFLERKTKKLESTLKKNSDI